MVAPGTQALHLWADVFMLVIAHIVCLTAAAPHLGRAKGQARLVQVGAHSRLKVTARLERDGCALVRAASLEMQCKRQRLDWRAT